MHYWTTSHPDRVRPKSRGLLVTALIIALHAGCSPTSDAETIPASLDAIALPDTLLAFPQQAPVTSERARLASLAWGQLTLIDGCLRLVDPYDAKDRGHLIIWPADHTVVDEDGQLSIFDGAGQRVASVGDNIWVGGGEDDRIEPITETAFGLQAPTPAECLGPYWVMGNIEHISDPTPSPY